MKRCSKCKNDYPVTEFFLDHRDGSRRSYCRQCSYGICKRYRGTEQGKRHKKLARKRYRQQQISFVNELKALNKCQVCNESCLACLDFHHLGDKDGQVMSFFTWTKLITEIKKCIVLCCNCHRKKHAGIITIPNVPLTIPVELLQKYIQKPWRVKTI